MQLRQVQNMVLKKISQIFEDEGKKVLLSIIDQFCWSLFSFINLGLMYARLSLDTVAVLALILSSGYVTSLVLKANFVNPRFTNESRIPLITYPMGWRFIFSIAVPTIALSCYILLIANFRDLFFQSIVLFVGVVIADLIRNINLANQFFRVNFYSLLVLAVYLVLSLHLPTNKIIIVFGFSLWLYALTSLALGSRIFQKQFRSLQFEDTPQKDLEHTQTLLWSSNISLISFLINNLLLVYLNPQFIGATTILNLYLAGITLTLSTALSNYISLKQRNRIVSSFILMAYWLVVVLFLTINYLLLPKFIGIASLSNSDYSFVMAMSPGTYFLTLSVSLWQFFSYYFSIHLSRCLYILIQFLVSLNLSLVPTYVYLSTGVLAYNATLAVDFFVLASCIHYLSRRMRFGIKNELEHPI